MTGGAATGCGLVHPTPTSPAALPVLLAQRLIAAGPGRVRMAVDGAPAADPAALADRVAAALPGLGRPAVRVSAAGFWRPASVRLEHGRHDVQSYRELWLDEGALRREVLAPFAASGRYLPALWDAERDRAVRLSYEQTADSTVLVVDGSLLLDRGLSFDFAVHMRLSVAALRRRTPEATAWTVPAYEDYRGEQRADVVVRWDDPAHPAIVVR